MYVCIVTSIYMYVCLRVSDHVCELLFCIYAITCTYSLLDCVHMQLLKICNITVMLHFCFSGIHMVRVCQY